MSTPQQQITLLDMSGDELFGGSSVMAEPPATVRPASATLELDFDDEEPCPETLRSSVSPRSSGEHPIEVTIVESVRAESPRAA